MRRTAVILLVMVLAVFTIQAQSQDKRIQKGMSGIVGGEYQTAYDIFTGIINKAEGEPKQVVAEAYFYRGKSRMGLIMDAYKSQDQEKIETAKRQPIEAYYDYRNAKKYDEGPMADRIKMEIDQLYGSFEQSTVGILNTIRKQSDEVNKQADLDKALEYSKVLVEMRPDFYFTYDLRGQVRLLIGKTETAKADFEKAIELYNANKPEMPDMYIGYTYYHLSTIQADHEKKAKDALATIKDGLALIEAENKRLKDNSEADEQMRAMYQQVRKDLTGHLLNTYLKLPELYDEAKEAFTKALEAYPKEYEYHIGYARLLEKNEPAKAEEKYIAATQMEPAQKAGWFYLGIMYVNQAAEISTRMAKTSDEAEKEALNKQAEDKLSKAYPALKRAHELDTKDKQTLEVLLQVTKNLEMDKEYNSCLEKLEELKGE